MPRRADEPIRIAGAGLSGLSAALTLARAGRPVEVYEARRRVGARHHGDLQGIENWTEPADALARLAALGLAVDCPTYPVGELHLVDDRGRDVVVGTDRPLAYLVRRGPAPGTLDDALRREVEALGVPIRLATPLARNEADIWATGPPRATGIVAGYTFAADRDFLCVCVLDDALAPGGYVYLNVAGGHGTLATVLLRDFASARRRLEAARRALVERFDLRLDGARPFGGIGYFRPPRRRAPGPLEVGEAGGFQDLLFGFGIVCALASGHLAARAILEGEDYGALSSARLAPALRASLANRLLFDLGGRLGRRYLVRGARRLGPRRFLERWYRFGPSKKALYPLARAWASLRFRGGPFG